MRNDMLFIDGKLVDLDDNTKITLNFKSNIFTDLSKIVSNNSYTIKLPKTIRNQRIISHAELPSADSGYPRKYHDARYFRNGVEVIPTAKAVLISISDKIEIWMLVNMWEVYIIRNILNGKIGEKMIVYIQRLTMVSEMEIQWCGIILFSL